MRQVDRLATVLDELSTDGRAPGQFDFTEPHVRFAYVPWPKRTLQLTFTGEGAPQAVSAQEREAGVTLEFPLSEADARELAGQIRNALADFPPRGGAA